MSISEDLKYIGCQVDELEIQNARLQGLVDSLTEQLENQSVDEKVVRLLDLLETYITGKEKLNPHSLDSSLLETIAVYRQIRPL